MPKMSADELIALRDRVEDKAKEVERLRGRLDAVKAKMKEIGCKDEDELSSQIRKLKKERKKQVRKLDAVVKSIRNKLKGIEDAIE